MKVFAICPTAKIAVGAKEDAFHRSGNTILLVVGFHLAVLCHNNKANQVFCIVGATFLKDGQVHLLVLCIACVGISVLNLEVSLHIFWSKTILVAHHCNHRLQCKLLISAFHHTIGEGTYYLIFAKNNLFEVGLSLGILIKFCHKYAKLLVIYRMTISMLVQVDVRLNYLTTSLEVHSHQHPNTWQSP